MGNRALNKQGSWGAYAAALALLWRWHVPRRRSVAGRQTGLSLGSSAQPGTTSPSLGLGVLNHVSPDAGRAGWGSDDISDDTLDPDSAEFDFHPV